MIFTPSPAIRGIIFDLGNVLINFDHRTAAARLSGIMHKSPEEIYSFFFCSGVAQLFEAGKISPEEFFVKIKAALGIGMEFAAFLPVWNEIFFLTEENKALYLLAKQLKKNYKTLLLSNINILHFNYLREHFPVFDVFHGIVLSFEAGAVKPDPLIYRKALELMGLCPEEAFYTDDRPDLIEGSRLLGIQGFVYKGVEQFKKDLASCGVGI
jgi:glucose-1-phosphatase